MSMSDHTTSIKHCNTCNRDLPRSAEYFSRDKGKKDGLASQCKDCIRRRLAAWRNQNIEDVRSYQRVWQTNNREKVREYNKSWKTTHRQISKARAHRRFAREKSLPATFTATDWRRALEYFDYRCAVCGRPQGFFHKLAADHWIPLNDANCPGTIATNIIPLCHGEGGCNNSKHCKLRDVWLTEKYGKRKAKQIINRIQEYFEHLAA